MIDIQHRYRTCARPRQSSASGDADNFAWRVTITAKVRIKQGVGWGRANLADGTSWRELPDQAMLDELQELHARRAKIEKATFPADAYQCSAAIDKRLKNLDDELGVSRKTAGLRGSHALSRGGRFTATEGKPKPTASNWGNVALDSPFNE